MSGRFVFSDEALSFGLVNRVVSGDNLDQETRNWALEIGSASRMTLVFYLFSYQFQDGFITNH